VKVKYAETRRKSPCHHITIIKTIINKTIAIKVMLSQKAARALHSRTKSLKDVMKGKMLKKKLVKHG